MKELDGTVQVVSWVLCLINENDKPTFYYNPVDDIFERKFNSQCALVDTMMDVFVEQGLVRK